TDTDLPVSKTSFYNALDYLFDNKEQILKNVNNQLVSENKRKLQVLWYDTTTAYFESFSRVGIRLPGFSKDGKFKEDQVVIGLITDENGIPLHYRLFPGNTTDSKTFIHFMLEMKRIYEIEKVVIVCDKGMSINANIRFLEAHGIDYIISYRMKAGSKKVKEYVLKQDDYLNYSEDFKYKEQTYFSTWQNGRKTDKVRRRIISYSSSRASKDRKERENLINNFYKKAKNGMVSASDLNSIKKYKFFQKVNEDTLYKLNYDKIEEDEQFDGYYIYETSLLNISPSEIISIYQKQWQIEENFRVLKGTLELRPMFVWTYKHIEAYVLLSFLALVVLKYAIYWIQEHYIKDSGLVENITVTKFLDTLKVAQKITKEVNGIVVSVEYENSKKLNNDLQYIEKLVTKYM
ncbi:IS1634 family transposase, partial [Mycoplasmopsis anatis]